MTLAVLMVASLAACGGSGGGGPSTAGPATAAPPTSAPTTAAAAATPPGNPTVTAAPASCPTAAAVNAALGVQVPAPLGIKGGTKLPAGATGVVCEYHAAAYNVIIEVITNIDPSYVSQFTKKFPVAGSAVSGLGDQADAFSQALGGGKVNEGVVASKGSTIVDITATATPATLAQLEAFVATLL
jgi:hypothetical protein